MPFEHIFFDLDNTLWDLETNSRETLLELIERYDLKNKGLTSPEEFISFFYKTNEELWEAYRKNLVDKNTLRFERFKKTFKEFNIVDSGLSHKMGNDYTTIAPTKANLMPFAMDILNYLQPNYQLHIITNGFEEIQHIKMKSSGIYFYFDNIITADNSGYKKPDAHIFHAALERSNATAEKSIMIGDDFEPDILGAKNVGMEAVYFNLHKIKHTHQLKYEIASLSELKRIL